MTEELHTHSAASDTIFHRERHPLRKLAMLLTIPCAILPMLIACSGLMVAWSNPLLFGGDFMLFGSAYLLYFYGLLLSLQRHRNPKPLSLALLHLVFLARYLLAEQPEWSGYLSVVSLMLTSVVNQYYRNGNTACTECAGQACSN